MSRFRIITLSAIFLLASGANGVFWNDLRVTFTLKFPAQGFTVFPRTVRDAVQKGFVNTSPTCTNNGEFYGFRYQDPLDDSVAVLFDVQGTVAGIQLSLPESLLMVKSNYKYAEVPRWQPTWRNGQKYYLLTGYFVAVDTICKTGRPQCALLTEGTGTNMYFYNGKTNIGQTILLELPRNRPAAIAKGWSKNKCVPGMGNHNYYLSDNWGDNNCTTTMMQPFFGLYNQQDELHGIGFTIVRSVPYKRYEIQTKGNIVAAQGESTPKCVLDKIDTSGISTLHVYFVNDPWHIECPGMPTLSELIKSINEKEHEAAKINAYNGPPPPPRIQPRVIKVQPGTDRSSTTIKTIVIQEPSLAKPQNQPLPPTGDLIEKSNHTFQIPASIMKMVSDMGDRANEASRASVADDLRPGEKFEDVDLSNALLQYTLNKGIENTTNLSYDIADALRLANEDDLQEKQYVTYVVQ